MTTTSTPDALPASKEAEAVEPLKAALRAYAEASKGKPCPICGGTESCDHTVKERLRADLAHPPTDAGVSEDVAVINGSPIAIFVQGYQFDASDEGDLYTPTHNEQCMIEDAICSFISDPALLRAALSAAIPAGDGVPPGMVLVPREPTAEMYQASYSWFGSSVFNFGEMYRAMLAAVPQGGR